VSDMRGADFDKFMALYSFPGEFLPVNASLDLGQRFNTIRHNYRRHQAMVDAGLAAWFKGDPYELGDWLTVFTPIEFSMWQDIRANGLDLWPQLPVGRFFVDFGNPVARVAIECDGRAFHQDKAKDQNRDAELERMGWRIYRVPGWQCHGRILDKEEADMTRIEDKDAWNEEKTPLSVLLEVKDRLEWSRE
jgi:very-short-patch-repair endonuclease